MMPRWFLILLTLLLFTEGLSGKGDKDFKNVAKELRDSARKTRMDKELDFAIADREEFLTDGLEKKTINPAEEKKIRSSLRKLRAMQKTMRTKGSLSPKEHKRFQTELAYCYHLIYFASRKEGEFTYSLENGKKFYLHPEYQKKADRASLSRKDMQEIHKVMNQVWRLRARFRNPDFPKEEKPGLLEACKNLLLEKYFTETKPLPPPPKKAASQKTPGKKSSSGK